MEIVYVFPNINGSFIPLAERFVATYNMHQPSVNHSTTVVFNGNAPNSETESMFLTLPNLKIINHNNEGYDIGAFQFASSKSSAETIVFFGSSTYFKREGWLLQMLTARQRHGEALYGSMGNRGVAHVGVRPHIRTTGFWMSPSLFNRYPMKVLRSEQRYTMEHGQNCLTEWCKNQGLRAWVCGWSGEYQEQEWDNIPGGFHRGSQEDLLCGDRISEPPYHHCQ